MKTSNIYILSAIICFVATACVSKVDTATVKIKAKNLDGREVVFNRSYNGVSLTTNTPAEFGADSTFTLTIPTEGIEYIRIIASDPNRNLPYIYKAFYALPGTTEVTIDPLAEDNIAVIPPSGNLIDGQAAQSAADIYDIWLALATGRIDALGLKADTVPTIAIGKLNEYTDSIINSYSIASPAVRKALELDIAMMKLMVFDQCVFINRKKSNAAEWKSEFARLREKTDMKNPANALNPFFGEQIASSLFAGDVFTDYNYPTDVTTDSLLRARTEYYLATYDGKTAESAIGTMLYNDGEQSTFSLSAPAITERFKELFPTSGLIPLLDEKAAANKAFNNPEESEDIVFLDNSKIKTLAEVLTPYKGKPVLIDLWATWCGPCRESFAHIGPIQEYAVANNVQLLYISVDEQPGIDEQWKRMARYFKLKGHHLLIDPEIKQEVYSTFGSNGYLSIPRYAIVDREGNLTLCPQNLSESTDPTPLLTLLDEL